MPIYKYICGSCSLNFEDVVDFNKSHEVKCVKCGAETERQFPDSISVKTSLDPKRDTIVSPKEIDKVIGADADKKREIIENRSNKSALNKSALPSFGFDKEYHDQYRQRQQKRRKGLEPKEIEIPKDADGKYTPIMHLGDEKEKKVRKEFVEALDEHRAKRKDRGEAQFDESKSDEFKAF